MWSAERGDRARSACPARPRSCAGRSAAPGCARRRRAHLPRSPPERRCARTPRRAGRSAGPCPGASPSRCRSARTRPAPRTITVCTSWPQAWQTPGLSERVGDVLEVGQRQRVDVRAQRHHPLALAHVADSSPVPVGSGLRVEPGGRRAAREAAAWCAPRPTRAPGGRAGHGERPRARRRRPSPSPPGRRAGTSELTARPYLPIRNALLCGVGRLVDAPDVAQGVADLPDGRPGAQRVVHGVEHVVACLPRRRARRRAWPPRRRSHGSARSVASRSTCCGLDGRVDPHRLVALVIGPDVAC